MANLKEIRIRIASVTTTRQITSAMKMVSAAKLKRAQDAVLQIRPYSEKLSNIITNVLQTDFSEDDKKYTEQRNINSVLIVLVTSNRGLCGAFNSNVIKGALSIALNDYNSLLEKKRVKFLCIGKKGYDYLKGKDIPIINYNSNVIEKPDLDSIYSIADEIIESYLKKEFDKIIVVYNSFKNAAVQILTKEQFLPLKIDIKKTEKAKNLKQYKADYIIEPSRKEIIEELLPKYLKVNFYKAIIDSIASEHGARMTAMHKATDNATELLKELILNYNKARQATITNEILEIVSGAEALKG